MLSKIKEILKNNFPFLVSFLKKLRKQLIEKSAYFISYNNVNKYVKHAYSLSKTPAFALRLYCLLKSKKNKQVKSYFENKSVALIGNAESLLYSDYGSEIDEHDIVIRINRAKIVQSKSQGTKTDIWATSFSYDLPPEFEAKYTLWLFPIFYGKELKPRKGKNKGELILYKYNDFLQLQEKLGSQPTTGLMIIDFLLKYSHLGKLDLYGFDFFKSNNLYDKRKVTVTKHDFSSEEVYVSELIKNNNKIELKKVK